jgi:hypothetical protein
MAESLDVCPCGECVKQMGARDIKVGRVGLCERMYGSSFLSGALRGVGGGCEGAGYRNREVVEGCKTQATLASVRALALALSGLVASGF